MKCVAYHAYHAFLKTLYECMFIVNCLMFRLAERNEELLQLKLLPLPYCQRQVAYMISPTYFVYACLVYYIYLMHVLDSIAMLKQIYPLS